MATTGRQTVWDGDKDPILELSESTAVLEKNILSLTEVTRRWAVEMKSIQETSKAFQAIAATPTGSAVGDMERSNALHREAIELYKRQKSAKDGLEKSQAALDRETNLLRISEEKLNQEHLRTQKAELALAVQKNKLAAAQERINQKLQAASTAYQRVQGWLTKLTQEHRNLAIRQELGAKLTIEEIKRMDTLAGRITRYDSALKAVDATQGRHQRNVGNYRSAYDGLGNSINQLSRELPAFANSVQTGFMAISNNLPIFFDEIKRIRMANETLRSQGEQVTSVFKQLATGVFSIGTALSLGVTALTFLGPKLFEWISSLGGANKQLEENRKKQAAVNEQIKKASEYVGQESAEYVGYILELKRTNAGSEKRSKLITEINDKYGVTLKNIKDEALFQKQLNQQIQNYIVYQRARFEVDKNQELIGRNLTAQDKLRTETAKALGFTAKQLDAFAEATRAAMKKEQEAIDNGTFSVAQFIEKNEELENKKFSPTLTQRLEDYVTEIDSANKRLESYGFNILEADLLMEDLGFDTEKTTKETQKLTLALEAFDDELSRRLDLGERERKLRQQMTEIAQDSRIDVVSGLVEKELANQQEFAEKSGEIFVDTLENLINEEFQLRKDAAIQRAEFEKAEALKRVDATRVLEYERLTKERDELLKQEGLTAAGREKIRASYDDQLKVLNSRMLDEERIVALEREKIDLELQKNLGNLDQARLDRLKEVNDQLIEAQEGYADTVNKKKEEDRKKEIDDEKKHQKEMADLRKKATKEIIDELERQSKAREDKYEKEYQASKDLENQIIAESNAGTDAQSDSLAAQKKVSAEKMALKEREQRRQEALAQIQVAYEIIEQLIAKGDSAPVATAKTIGMLDVIKAAFLKAKGFYGGTKRTVGEELGNPLFSGRDGHVIRVDGAEKILNPALSKKTGNATTDQIVDGFLKYDSFRVNDMIMRDNMGRIPAQQDITHNPIFSAQLKELQSIKEVVKDWPREWFDTKTINGVLHAVHMWQQGNDTKQTFIDV